jgi:hypothetical protein
VAVQIESRGQVQDFLDVLRRRVWQVALPALFVIVIGACLATIVPRKFLAETQLELRQVGPSLVGKEGQNAQFQILAPARIKKVVEDLRSPVYLAFSETDRREFLAKIQKNLRVRLNSPGSQSSIFITISYTDVDRAWAGSFLTALRDDWKDDVLELDRNKLKDEMQRLGVERGKLEKQFLKEEEDLAELKRKNAISPTQPIPGAGGQRSEDPDYDRLQSAKTQLFLTDLALGNTQARILQLEKRLADLPEMISREQLVAGVGHEKEIEAIETRILDLTEKLRGYGKANFRYQRTLNEIGALERKKAGLEGLVTGSELTSHPVPNPERITVRKEIETAKDEEATHAAAHKLLAATIATTQITVSELHDVYREVREREERIGRLKVDLVDAERSYQKKVQEVELTEGPGSNPFAILEEIHVPPKPTEPNPWFIVAFSIVAGLGAGVGLAVGLEYSKSCFRSIYDISRVMVVPVLGNINTIVTRREARLRRTRRLAVACASALILGSLSFVTWAWTAESGFLSPSLRNAIEDLRSALK